MNDFKVLLKEVDVNGDGRINLRELRQALHRLNLPHPGWKAFLLMRQVDVNGNHLIDGNFEVKVLINLLREWYGIVIS
ncbi:hypothetical protein QJS04_geneDACA017224 [Acorus gramineus]|uniref:EF-hand domain-containing protein n=1 Tax=Acorus gramineus TaxID=55184 RepID=A0AAV8ZZW4_ACOGR|nr:hypothetical protein QJS04_geneDACA017224 [Acorus gramineus]